MYVLTCSGPTYRKHSASTPVPASINFTHDRRPKSTKKHRWDIQSETRAMEIGEGGATHVVDFPTFINEGLLHPRRPRVNEGLLAKMEDRISKSTHPSTGTNETGNNEKRCIFRLHRRLKNINSKLFEPQVISLGPYHHGKHQLQNMEELQVAVPRLLYGK